METRELRVRNYRCIEDTGWVSVGGLTPLVGRNESGKTAFLRAVEKLNPSFRAGEYSPYDDYPREEWPRYKRRHDDDPDVVASARFRLDDREVRRVEEAFGGDILADREVVVHKDYANDYRWELDLDETACASYLVERADPPDDVRRELESAASLAELEAAVGDTDADADLAEFAATLDGDPLSEVAGEIGATVLAEELPEFRYIGEYEMMNGTIEVDRLLEDQERGDLDPSDAGFLSLLSIADVRLETLAETDDWRETLTELEVASGTVSDDAMRYWSQSGDVAVRLRSADAAGDRVIEVRVENRREDVSVEFDQRSRGFRWFFSMFCQLADFARGGDDTVVLLDEPGLNLHPRAKREFLSFLDRELSTGNPTVYTTHSPFMIDPAAAHRVKLMATAESGGPDVIDDVSRADDYTRFPVRNVFELDLLDTLLVRPQTLLVEEKADHVYLYNLSKTVEEAGKTGLDRRWTVVPVHTGENVGSFVSLFESTDPDVAALLNDTARDRDRDRGRDRDPTTGRDSGRRTDDRDGIDQARVKTAADYADAPAGATVEDLLSDRFYVELVNRAYASALAGTPGVPDQLEPSDLAGDGPIVDRVAAYFAEHDVNYGTFDRTRPAIHLQNNRAEMAEELDDDSRRRFAKLFIELNGILEEFEDETDGGLLRALGLA